MKAPDFSLPDQNGNIRTLADFKGTWLVIYFYPKDDTPGCTKEACAFRDAIGKFNDLGVQIVGISKDSVVSHKKFSEKYHLPFPILSDPDHSTIESYGAWGKKSFMGREFTGTLRNTYLVSPDGAIVKEFHKVTPLTHANEVLIVLGDLLNL